MASPNRTERLEARIPANVKAILSRAASLQGRSLSDFVVGTATDVARRIIRENEILVLSERDQLAFAQSLLKPPRPSRALRAAARRYRARRA